MLMGIIMKRIIIPLIVITLVLAVSCSGASQGADSTVSALLTSAMNEAVDKSSPSTTNNDGSRTYIITGFRAANGAVISGAITVDANGNIISATLEEFEAGGETGRFEAETDGNGNLTSSVATVSKINILTADGKPEVPTTTFSANLFVVEVTYTDGKTRTLGGEGLVIAEYDKNSDGSYTWNGTVEASYGGKTVKKTFVLNEEVVIIPPFIDNGDPQPTNKPIGVELIQPKPVDVGGAFKPSFFDIKVLFTDGTTEVYSGIGYVELEIDDGTMDRGDYVIADFDGIPVRLAIVFND